MSFRLRAVVSVWLAACIGVALETSGGAQSKPTVKPDDYGQFETLGPGAGRGGLSPDGKWLAYSINRVNGDSELRITNLAAEKTTTVAFGSQASFSSNMKWIAYGIGFSEAEQERMRTARQPIQRKLGLMNLATGTEATIEGVETFAFDATGQSLAMKRYAPVAAGAGAGPAAPAAPPAGRAGGPAAAPATPPVGTTLIVRDLATGTDTTFGNVSEYAWQSNDTGRSLAMTISADGQAGNGVHLFNAATSVLRVLDSATASYSGLTWRDDSADLVVQKSKDDPKRDGPTQVVIAWTGVGQGNERVRTFDPTAVSTFPSGQRIVTFRRPSWSDDGRMVMLGVAAWDEKPVPAGRGAGRSGDAAGRAGGAAEGRTGGEGAEGRGAPAGRGAAPVVDEKPDLDVWHWNDPIVMAAQKLRAATDRRRNLLGVWHVEENTFVQIGKSFDEQVTPVRRTTMALVSEFAPYAMARSIGRPAADWFVADLKTGHRTPLKTGLTSNASVSAGGRYVLFTEGGHYWTLDLSTKAVTNITKGVKTSFVDMESDSTGPTKPTFGVAGWTKDDGAVLLYDKFDIWRIAPDGSTVMRLTNGGPEQVRHRIVRVDPEAETIDPADSFVSLFGVLTKKSGYARLGPDAVRRLVWLDKSVTSLAKAEHADVYTYTSQDADDSPDIFVGGVDLSTAKQTTATNPQLSKFAWGRTELVEFTTAKGLKLQGSLYYPASYEAGKKYPMVVYLYEKLSDGLHRFVAPSERDYYNATAFTQQGYFYFQPDIVFRPRDPGLSVVECVSAAVKKVVASGMVDGTKVGVLGHSWGGFDAMFLSTHSDIFAAAVSGAGISNLVSNYGNHHWSSGIAETDHIETGQQRMVVPLWEDLDAYIRNSAVYGVPTMKTPLLLMTGDQDGTVFWHQSVELYNIGRRAKKNIVMLVYNGEDHGLRVKKNQIDYHRRIQAWFAHYLKGEPAPKWITEGVTFLDKDKK